MRPDQPLQLPLLPPTDHWPGPSAPSADLGPGRDSWLVGFWAAGERWLDYGGRLVEAAVWFHFTAGGAVAFSVRWGDQAHAVAETGRWRKVDGELEVDVDTAIIRGPMTLADGVLYWAGEVLLRLPDEAAPIA